MTYLQPLDQQFQHGFEAVSTDPAVIRTAFGRFPSGIAALSALVDGAPVGIVASSFSVGASFDPPLVMFSVQNSSTTWPTLRRHGRIGVSVLGSEHAQLCYQLASRSGDRFAGVPVVATDEGALFIDGSALWLDCEILSETAAGDHHIVLLEVKALKVEADQEPLIYHGATFRQLAS
ncbi:flavin reductase (DIM6/NTAB) family NADH-FMN oxidoreductase RutF [Glaciihabitans tibetensis]|uniref:Flavin reductase (DIM6/NTAB) family NADH-FMN oxidoreductase RutF n=1 Tax=Glaciihabitans tibetensis TaxID=1266600 RepID=A0A2T0VCE9_9MICO|nr:flavin reductase family protein [Glaciihabitans tibetensis]PRY67859.1 flavin reductase (DIM6/NTAB) family NADH-FMN oxidoreductase RutF [Glaciihabitans tibetensis]